MNRGVLDRQMFKKGGQVFPDLSGDGKVTRKDILMGRGVLPMQEGGMVPAEQQGIDPMAMEAALGQAAQQFTAIDGAQNYEEMMNAIRGDQQSIGERRDELADLVGPEDAQQTPESVLTLLQPVIQLAAVDQGIGGLAEGAMGSAAVEGPMAEGIMSTVNMAPEQAPMPMEGGAPVQGFRYGGVVKMAEGGNPFMARTKALMPEYQELYKDILGGTPAEDLAEQRRLSQAQALFDIAQAGFAFAQPGSRRQSAVSRLGEAITETQLFPKIGARAAELKGFEREQDRQQRALDLTALQGAMGQTERERASAAAKEAEERQFLFQLALEKVKAGGKVDPRLVLTNDDLRKRFAAKETDEAEDLLVQQVIAEYTSPERVYDFERQMYVAGPKKQLAPQWTEALQARGLLEAGATGEKKPAPSGVVSPIAADDDTAAKTPSFLPGQRPGTSMELATGPQSAIGEIANTIAGIVNMEIAPQSEQAITALRTLNTDTVLGILQARGQRDNQQLQSQIRALFPEAGSFFTSDPRAAAKTRSVVDMLNNDLARLQTSLQPENAQFLKRGDIAEKRESLTELTQYRDQYMRLLQDLERRLNPEMTVNELDAFYQGN